MAVAATAFVFDFGTSNSPTAPGATAVPLTVYKTGQVFGWTSTTVMGLDRGTSDPLTRDFNYGTNATFLVNLPNATYNLTATFGDALGSSRESISAQGRSVLTGLQTTAGNFTRPGFQVAVTNGQLSLQFTNDGVNGQYFKLDALSIAPAMSVSAGSSFSDNEGTSATFAGQATGASNLTYSWSFGDGGTATGTLTPQHVYQDNGTYTATLTAIGTGGISAVSTSTIVVSNVVPKAQAGGPYTVSAGQALTLRASATDPSPVDTAAGFSYAWDFGDGTTSRGLGLTTPVHSYRTAGTYKVGITATDKDNGTSTLATSSVTVTPPLAALVSGPNASLEGTSITLKASASGGLGHYSYSWDRDNNGSYETAGPSTSVTFADNGTYTVGLRATDSTGLSAVSTATIVISNVAPTAVAGKPYATIVGQPLVLHGSANDPSPVDTAAGFTYRWDFGDGTVGTGANPTHTYSTAGKFTANVIAVDKDGATSLPVTAIVTSTAPGPRPSFYFDFGTSTSPVATGAIGVSLPHYSAARGYGWASIAGLTALDRGTADPTTRDFVSGADGTFVVDMPNGTYNVTATLGEPYNLHDLVAIWAQGQPVASGLTTQAGQTLRPTYAVSVTNGQLSFRIADQGGIDPNFTLDALQVHPAVSWTVSAGGPYAVNEGTAITLSATTSGGIGPVSYAWDLDNSGNFQTTGQSVAVTFADNGTYTVGLRATDSKGLSALSTVTIVASNVAPTALAGAPYATIVGKALVLRGSATDPSPVDTAAGFTYTWNFGDGTPQVTALGLSNPSHTYSKAGNYNLSLNVMDKDGGSSSDHTTVTILDAGATGLGLEELTAGWATFGEVLPEGEATGSLQLGNLPTQTDVKTTWPDGSIRYAVVTAYIPSTSLYAITQGSSSTGVFTPTLPVASVNFLIGGVTYTASLPNVRSSDIWLNGPLVSEWRTTVAPVDPSGNPHPFLRVIFDTRSYNNGQDRLDVTVENDLDVAGATALSYDVSILAGASTLFSQSGVIQHYLTRWRQVFDLGLTESRVTHDFTSFYQAGAFPQFLSTVSDQTYSTTGPTFGILGKGGNSYDYMGATGGRPELGPYPDWVASYLLYQSPDQYSYVTANGDLAGSWPIHVREPDGSLVSIDSKPNFWLDSRGQQYQPFQEDAQGDLSASSLGPLFPDDAHVPSLSYVPYLITGDRYYADEMGYWGDWALTGTWSATIAAGGRGGSEGIVGTTQVRARAWGLRNLVDAAAYLPDADPAKAYLASKVANNLNYYDAYARTHVSPLGTVLEIPSGTNLVISQWQNNYLAWSLDHATQQGFRGGLVLRDQIAAFQLKLFTSGSDYPREYGAPYYPIVGQILPDGTWQYFTTMGEVFHATFVNPDGSVSSPIPFAGYYGVDARLSLMLDIAAGLAGAQDAYDWLLPQISSDLNNRWAIAQRPATSKAVPPKLLGGPTRI